MSSEIYSYLYEKLLDIGALDVYTESIYMKKNRPATKLSVLCKESCLEDIKKIIMTETSTFGVRYHKYIRETLLRRFEKLGCKYGNVTVKLGYYDGNLIKATPEYEECKNIAKELNLPLIKVYEDINHLIKNNFM
ncbi:MAG: nickel insertion protein [Paraclostridium sp.]